MFEITLPLFCKLRSYPTGCLTGNVELVMNETAGIDFYRDEKVLSKREGGKRDQLTDETTNQAERGIFPL